MVDVPEDVLTDLSERLRRTRFPNEIPGIGWQQGIGLDYLREIVRYWLDVPTGVANYPGELIRSLRPHAERFFNIVHWSELPCGGHFPAMEVPDIFVEDVRAFFRPLR